MTDVMWADPAGRRILLVDRREAAEFITAVYGFDEIRIVEVAAEAGAGRIVVSAGPLRLELTPGRAWPIPLARMRRWPLVRVVERILARLLLGVRTVGVSPTGVREWYRADRYWSVRAARAALDGTDLGRLGRFAEPAGFGFSEPPRSPAVVRVSPLLKDLTGDLSAVLRGLPG